MPRGLCLKISCNIIWESLPVKVGFSALQEVILLGYFEPICISQTWEIIRMIYRHQALFPVPAAWLDDSYCHPQELQCNRECELHSTAWHTGVSEWL